ncbi:MAG: hypothetical protein Q8R11_00465, partial [bacterium]|nr:hypothetical protein [bacterium]
MVGCLLGVAFFSGLLLLNRQKTSGVQGSAKTPRAMQQKPPNNNELSALLTSTFAGKEETYAIVIEDLAADRRASMQDDRVMQTASLSTERTMAALFDAANKSGEEMSD